MLHASFLEILALFVLLFVGSVFLKRRLLLTDLELQTGEDRRRKYPLGVRTQKPDPLLIGSGWEAGLEIKEGLFSLLDGQQLYWVTVTPEDLSKIECVLVFLHGYSRSCNHVELNNLITLAKLGNCACIGVDALGHGRSDGLHLYIDDWSSFVGASAEFVERFVTVKQAEWNRNTAKQLKRFGLGESMGGGMLVTMCLNTPNLLDGVVLFSPLIAVSKETMPPEPVIWTLKNIITPVLPDWPLTPSKNCKDVLCTDPDMCELLGDNPFADAHGKPRLRTALSLAFDAPEWMEPRLKDFSTPFFIFHAAGDQVTDPAASTQLYETAVAQDKSLKLYGDTQHMDPLYGGKMQEALVQEVYSDILHWLQQRW